MTPKTSLSAFSIGAEITDVSSVSSSSKIFRSDESDVLLAKTAQRCCTTSSTIERLIRRGPETSSGVSAAAGLSSPDSSRNKTQPVCICGNARCRLVMIFGRTRSKSSSFDSSSMIPISVRNLLGRVPLRWPRDESEEQSRVERIPGLSVSSSMKTRSSVDGTSE